MVHLVPLCIFCSAWLRLYPTNRQGTIGELLDPGLCKKRCIFTVYTGNYPRLRSGEPGQSSAQQEWAPTPFRPHQSRRVDALILTSCGILFPCRCSSVVEQRFCKPLAGSSILPTGSMLKAYSLLPVSFVLCFYCMAIGAQHITLRNLRFILCAN